MAVPKRKVSKARRDKRRSNVWKLALPGMVKCPKCGEYNLAHRVCKNCGCYDGKVLSPQSTLPVYQGYKRTGKSSYYTPYFHYNDTLSIKLANLDEAGFRFWDSYTKNLSLQGNLFLASYVNFPTNINGGIGYWCGMGTDIKNLIVSRWLNENK